MSEKPNSDREQKEQEITQIRGKVENFTDGVGGGMDEGIKETVVFLQALKLPTEQSCEGHAIRGHIQRPWVRFAPPNEPKFRFIGDREFIDEVREKYKGDKRIEPWMMCYGGIDQLPKSIRQSRDRRIDGLYAKAQSVEEIETREWVEWERGLLELKSRLDLLLAELYSDDIVDEDIKIKTDIIVGSVKISSGREILMTPAEERKYLADHPFREGEAEALLKKCQAEMARFTEFLKKKYFGE